MNRFGNIPRLTLYMSLLAIALIVPSGSPTEAAGPPGGLDVNVVNTPLSVQGAVNAKITGTPNVNVVNTPTVQVTNADAQPLLVQTVNQGQASPTGILPPTGRTIGGPGLFSRSGPGSFFILNSTLRSNGSLVLPITACATVVATGSSPVFFSTVGDEGGFGSDLAPGDTLTFCNAKADRFTLECPSGPCSAVWRIDEADVGKSRLP